MLNITNFPQSRLKQMLANIDKAWCKIGDTTNASDLAYWYNTRTVKINLRPIMM